MHPLSATKGSLQARACCSFRSFHPIQPLDCRVSKKNSSFTVTSIVFGAAIRVFEKAGMLMHTRNAFVPFVVAVGRDPAFYTSGTIQNLIRSACL